MNFLNTSKCLQQIDPKVLSAINKKHDTYTLLYQKRKRMCMNIIDGIMEGFPKTKQKLMEDIEIETDEAAGFKAT